MPMYYIKVTVDTYWEYFKECDSKEAAEEHGLGRLADYLDDLAPIVVVEEVGEDTPEGDC